MKYEIIKSRRVIAGSDDVYDTDVVDMPVNSLL